MKKIRIGILGCADIANRLVIPNIRKSYQFELVAVASRSQEKAEAFASRFNCFAVHGYENLISRSDIDSVYLPLPNGLHHEWIMKSLKHGKHVLAEKPFTEDYSKTKEIIDLANKNKLCVYENFMFTYHTQFDTVFKLLESGEIGEIRLFKSSFGFPEINKSDNIRYKKQLAGGAVLDAGAYTVKASSFFLGPELKVIGADLNKLGNEVDFQGSAMLRNKKGIIAQIAVGFDNFYLNAIEIWGSKGKITLSRAFTAREGFMPGITIEKQNKKTEISLPADNQMQKILLDFSQSIKSDYSKEFQNILLQSKLLTDIIDHA